MALHIHTHLLSLAVSASAVEKAYAWFYPLAKRVTFRCDRRSTDRHLPMKVFFDGGGGQFHEF